MSLLEDITISIAPIWLILVPPICVSIGYIVATLYHKQDKK